MSKQHFQNVAYMANGPFEKKWGTIVKDDNGVSMFAPFAATYLEEGDSEFVSCSADYTPDVVRIPMKAGQ